MAITLGQLQRNLRSVPVAYDGLVFNVNYRPAGITPTFGEGEQNHGFLVDMLLQLLESWDIFEDDAQTQRVPITAEVLNGPDFGLPLLRVLFNTILDDALLGKQPGATSAAG